MDKEKQRDALIEYMKARQMQDQQQQQFQNHISHSNVLVSLFHF